MRFITPELIKAINQIQRTKEHLLAPLNAINPRFIDAVEQLQSMRDHVLSSSKAINPETINSIANSAQFAQSNSQLFLDALNTMTTVNQVFTSSITNLNLAYYPALPPSLEDDLAEVEIEPREFAYNLVQRLNQIEPGAEWREYQSLCKEILEYCLVPPLLEPLEEVRTIEGITRRDLIFYLPFNPEGFWFFIKNTCSSLAVIVECKNMRVIDQNNVIITSKYLHKKKLGQFGFLISHEGPDNNAKHTLISRWTLYDETIICLTNHDLENMIKLKINEDNPTIIINQRFREFRESIP